MADERKSDDALEAFPVVEPPSTGREAAECSVAEDVAVAGVLLAGGTSSRFGDANKLLVDVDGVPMVRRSARTLLDADLEPVVVVVGYEASLVRCALDGLDVRIVENPDYRDGQATSLRAGVRALDDATLDSRVREGEPTRGVDAAVFALGDMPYVDPSSVEALVASYVAEEGSALAAGYDGVRGNPVLFDQRHFGALVATEGDVGGRAVFESAASAAVVETGDPGVRRDVDRPDDFS